MISTLEFKNQVHKPVSTNHVLIVDVSGSMYGSLAQLRQHIKTNLASMVKPSDTFSLIYFSGRNQAGVIVNAEQINSASDLSNINQQIDRFLKPIGLTGFVEPLQLAVNLVKEIKNSNANSMIFMTDGYDNCNSTSEILNHVEIAKSHFDSFSILEYGYYCNRPLLEKMAECVSATHVFAERVDDLNSSITNRLSQNNVKSQKIDVDASAWCAIWSDSTDVYLVPVKDSAIVVPQSVETVSVLDNELFESLDGINDANQLYMILFAAIQQRKDELVWSTLKLLGDVKLINMYTNSFTKQQHSDVLTSVKTCILDETARYVDGVNYNMIPNDDATTIIDVLEFLSSRDDVMLDTTSDYFSYNKIGLARKQKEDSKIDELAESMPNATTREERLQIATAMANHKEWTPKFKPSEFLFSMNRIVMNSSRPNISVGTAINGTIDIPSEVAEQYKLPSEIETHIHRTYTIVKDGIVNMDDLPIYVRHGADVVQWLQQNDVEFTVDTKSDTGYYIVINLRKIPLINRSMTKNISGKDFLENSVKLEVLKAEQKVLKHWRDTIVGKVNAIGLADKYGKDAAEFLSSLGIRDYGFSPKTERTESTDFYMSKEMNVKIKSLSSLPSIAAVMKKLESGKKLTLSESVVNMAIVKYSSQIGTMSLTKPIEDVKEFIKTKTREVILEVREIERQLSENMYAVVVGNAWFNDIDFDNPTSTIDMYGESFNVTIALEEKEIKI